MRRYVKYLAAAAFVAFCIATEPQTSRAAKPHHLWRGTVGQELRIAEQRAAGFWHARPCDGHYTVRFTSQVQLQKLSGLPPTPEKTGDGWAGEVEGLSEWESPSGSNSYDSPPSTWTNCIMYVDVADWPELYPRPILEYDEWPLACAVVLHEWGHLTGHPHSDVQGEPDEPLGTTDEQRKVMRAEQPEDVHRCGWEP